LPDVTIAQPSRPSHERQAITLLPRHEVSSASESEAAQQERQDTDRLISISDIRTLFKLGRTAAYELTHRSGFPEPVQVSRRCLRWWASEVNAYADTLQREGMRSRAHRATTRQADNSAPQPRRITGTVRAARGRKEPSR
jgi:predicted DNA-binding transcriptional regulator AlpA